MSNIFKVLSGKGSPTNNGASSPAGGNKPEVEGADEPTLAELLQQGAPIGCDRSQFLPARGHFQQDDNEGMPPAQFGGDRQGREAGGFGGWGGDGGGGGLGGGQRGGLGRGGMTAGFQGWNRVGGVGGVRTQGIGPLGRTYLGLHCR